MRHLVSIILSLLIAPAVYLLTGLGQLYWTGAGTGSGIDYTQAGYALAALVGAGALYSILTHTRLSPLGPLLGAVLLLGVAGWAIRFPATFGKYMPNSIIGIQGWGHAAAGPIAVLLAVPLIATIVNPRRWRTVADGSAELVDTSDAPVAAGITWPPTVEPTLAMPASREPADDEGVRPL